MNIFICLIFWNMLKYKGSKQEVTNILNYLIAILVGIAITFPIGPGGLLLVQRTIKKGMKIGYISAIGFIIADLCFGFIVLLSSSFIDKFVQKDSVIINLIIAVTFLFLGIKILKNKEHDIEDSYLHPTLSAFLLGLANPGTLFVYIGIFTFFPAKLGISNPYYTIEILFCIFLGSNILWFILTELISHIKKFFTVHHFFMMDKIIGGFITLTGLTTLIKTILKMKG